MKSDKRPRLSALVLAVLLTAGAVAGCTTAEEATVDEVSRSVGGSDMAATSPEAVTGEYAEDQSLEAAPASEGTAVETDRMIIRTQTLRLEVESTPDTVEALRELADTHTAVITDLQVATDTGDWLYRYDEYGYAVGDGAALRGWMTVRVPAESLDAFVDATMALGTVKYQAEDTEDVTQEHVDLNARLDNLRAEEVHLRSFFDAASDVQDMLAIEAELNRVRQEIESMDAQVKYLERQAAMATVTIELVEEQEVVRPEGEDWGFKEAITSGFRGAANVLTFAIAFLIATAPLWIFGLVVFFVVRAILMNRRKKRAASVDTFTAAPAEDPTGPAEE
ncbi:MAG: DUF4349 domain-containing protein [Coriobacteriia bacterium]|nr:DUF4349 domain-containing protein [Coriobacteriia bacterium]